MTTAIKSVSVSLDLLPMIEKHKISLSEAVRVGISVMLCDLGEIEYLNKTNIGRKIIRMSVLLKEMQNKLEKYENVVSKTE